MSERFVRGWIVSPEKLLALVGSGQLTARDVLESSANKKGIADVLMTLGEGDEDAGREAAEGALSAILEGELDPKRVYRYARVTEPLLNHVARPLATEYVDEWREPQDQILLQVTYHVPNDSHGRWSPLLEAAGLPKLAGAWGAPSFDFPWRAADAPDRGKWAWPVWMLLSPATLVAVDAELAAIGRDRIDALPNDLLTEEPDWADECRAELLRGLERLRSWVVRARAPQDGDGVGFGREDNSLVLLMDGDQ